MTSHQQTPLLLASKCSDSVPRYKESYRRSDGTFDIDTVRILVQKAKNGPMQTDCYGNTSISLAAGNNSKILPWLLSQDAYEIDLRYTTPSGHTAAAFISTREDFPDLLDTLLKNGISTVEPCAKSWYSYLLPTNHLGGKS